MSDYTVGDTLHFMFTTRRFSTGAPFQLAGTPAVSVYEDAGTTEITAGVTLGVDHDSRTGLNLVTVVATSGNGYESGKDYHLVVTAGTVDSVSVVGEVVGRFTLQKSAAAVDLANGTDGLGAIKTQTAAIEVDTADIQGRLPAALVSGRIDASVGAMASGVLTATAIAADAITAAKVAADVTTELQSGLATAASLTTVEGKIDTIDGIVDAILADTGTDGVVVAAASKTGYSLTATTGLGNQTANITGSLSGSVGSVSGAVGSVTGNVGGNVTGSVGSVAAGGITASSIAADAIGASELAADAVAEIADAVWDELLSGHAISGSTGAALSAAGGSGDPWSTALPGAYSAGTAGYIVGTNINATVSSRLASASYTAPLDAAGVRTAVGLASANLDTQIDALPTANENADALLKRDWTAVTGEAARSVLNALRFLRNKWSISGGTLTVTEEDDTTTAWTGTVTTSAGNPTTQIDPS